MNYYNAYQRNIETGMFLCFENGYYLFELENGVIINFEQINKNILKEFDLKSDKYKTKMFMVYYIEIFDDLDDEDFIIYKLDGLELL